MTSAEIAIEKGEAEVALEAAIPALEEAAEALNDLKKDDITEIRSFAKPHVLVQKAGFCYWLSASMHYCSAVILHPPLSRYLPAHSRVE